MNKSDVDKLADYLIKGCILMFDTLEQIHGAEPFICMTAKTNRGEYTVKISRDNKEDEKNEKQ